MAGSVSKVVVPEDRNLAEYVRLRLITLKRMVEDHGVEQKILLHLRDNVMQVCHRCGGSGTICETRTDEDSPFYQPCPACGGKGHHRHNEGK